MLHQKLNKKGICIKLVTCSIYFVLVLSMTVLSTRGYAQQKHGGQSGQLKVIVTGTINNAGQIRISLFDS
ncbi:MAG: hypothetical protein NT178_07655 [Proteobacteria bacterium]|nr:hypothetical protein [Pseudomonadota bacterium]